jgi:hypothetical protein
MDFIDALIYIGSAQVPYTTAETFDFESQRYASKSKINSPLSTMQEVGVSAYHWFGESSSKFFFQENSLHH